MSTSLRSVDMIFLGLTIHYVNLITIWHLYNMLHRYLQKWMSDISEWLYWRMPPWNWITVRIKSLIFKQCRAICSEWFTYIFQMRSAISGEPWLIYKYSNCYVQWTAAYMAICSEDVDYGRMDGQTGEWTKGVRTRTIQMSNLSCMSSGYMKLFQQ